MANHEIRSLENQRSLVDDVYDRIRSAIVTGELRPGQQIRQVPIAESIGVSQRTAREALMRLVSEGLALHEPRKGFRVASFPFGELEQIYRMRSLLEGWAMELAAERISADELEEMRRLLPSTVTTEPPGSVAEPHQANRQFHMIPIKASGAKHLVRVLSQLWQLVFTHYGGEEDPQSMAEVALRELQEHERILDALQRADGRAARSAIEEHIETTIRGLEQDWKSRAA